MNFIKQIFRNLIGFFKIIEENTQLNIISSLIKDEKGNTLFEIGPINNNGSTLLSPFEILQTSALKSHLRKKDLQIVQSVAFAEGDVYIISKSYKEDNVIMQLKSIINSEQWELTSEELKVNADLKKRLNKKYFDSMISVN